MAHAGRMWTSKRAAWRRWFASLPPRMTPAEPGRWSSATQRLRWAFLGMDTSKRSRLAEAATSGRRLQALMDHPGWADVLEAKAYYQALADRQTKTPSLPEAQRFKAACEWASIEGFFQELAMRVRRGKEADTQMIAMR